MTWYGTGLHKTAVHARPTCPRLLKGRVHPVVELDESFFQVNRLCKTCFSGQVASLHLKCRKCGHRTTRPCPHNGGVRVIGSTRLLWVWPEDSYGRTVVNPSHVL